MLQRNRKLWKIWKKYVRGLTSPLPCGILVALSVKTYRTRHFQPEASPLASPIPMKKLQASCTGYFSIPSPSPASHSKPCLASTKLQASRTGAPELSHACTHTHACIRTHMHRQAETQQLQASQLRHT